MRASKELLPASHYDDPVEKTGSIRSKNRPRVLLVENNEAFIELIVSVLPDDFDLVGVCRNGAEAIQSCLDLIPDLLLSDIVLPVMDGIQVTRELRHLSKQTKIIMITGIEDPQFVSAALAAGAKGYVFKRKIASDLHRAINAVLDGGSFVSPSRPVRPGPGR